MFPVVYNNGNQFLQTPGYVVLRNEMIHETRVIPLDGRPALSPRIRTYMGDSRGRFEGNTLVVRTIRVRRGFEVDSKTAPFKKSARLRREQRQRLRAGGNTMTVRRVSDTGSRAESEH